MARAPRRNYPERRPARSTLSSSGFSIASVKQAIQLERQTRAEEDIEIVRKIEAARNITIATESSDSQRCTVIIQKLDRVESYALQDRLFDRIVKTSFIWLEANKRREEEGLILPPGTRLRGWIELFFSQRTVTRVFDPIFADMHYEWIEAHKAGRLNRATWIRICCMIHMLQATAFLLPLSAARWIWEAWKKSRVG